PRVCQLPSGVSVSERRAQELLEAVWIELDSVLAALVLDVERRAEEPATTGEEVGRALHAAPPTLLEVALHCAVLRGCGVREVEPAAQLVQHLRGRDVEALVEQCLTYGQAE